MSDPAPVSAAAPIRRNVLSYQQKREIIQELESGVKNVDVCKKFGLPSSSVATIWRFRHKILAMEDIVSPTAKRARMCHKVDVDQAVYEWCRAAKAEGVRLSVALLKTQAEKIAQDLGHTNFQCSNGWLYRFRLRHNINIGKPRSSHGDKPVETPESEWLKMVWEDVLRDRYDIRDIYCAHEVGLFFNATPVMTRALAQEKCEEGQLSSYRLTLLLCCNMDGSHKRPLVAIGSGPPPDFSGMIGLPVTYVKQPKSWMTTDIFEKEMFLWDEELRMANKRILLLVNTSSAHIRLNSLESIHLCFLPREAPGLQPIERGISRCLRSTYRRQLLTRIIHSQKSDRTTQVTLLEALKLANHSWDLVTPNVVMDSFLTAGFFPGSEYRVPVQHLGLADWISEQNTGLKFEDLDTYEFIDDGLATSPPDDMPDYQDEHLVSEVDPTFEEPEDTDLPVVKAEPPLPLDPLPVARVALETLKSFFSERTDAPEVALALEVLRRNIEEQGLGVLQNADTNGNVEDSQACKITKPNPCAGCLGLLQKPYCDEIVDSIVRGVDVSEYDATTYNLSMNLPSCFLLRSEALLIELRKQFPAFYKEQFKGETLLALKDAFKASFSHRLGESFKLSLDLTSGFLIDVEFKYDDDAKECRPLCSLKPHVFTTSYVRKNGYPKNRIECVLEEISDDDFSKTFSVPPAVPSTAIRVVKSTVTRESTNVAGRYNKFCRELPQTPWVLNGERKMESSVQEIISGPIVTKLRGNSSKFASSGREDVDVRSLGRGRPFNVEVLMPKRAFLSFQELRELEGEIGENSEGKLRVRDLQIVSRDSLTALKKGEEEKTKEYTALCICPGGIPDTLEEAVSGAPIVLEQSTPIRVLHRRPVAVRRREILKMTAKRLEGDSRKFILTLRTQAGTYVKEFIHGDFGRTKPSFGDLLGGVKVDILALDVTDIALDWPPQVDYSSISDNEAAFPQNEAS